MDQNYPQQQWPQSILQGFGLVWKAGRLWIYNSEYAKTWLTKVGLELLGQLEIDITVLKTGRRFANEMKLLKNFHVDENKDEEKRLE